MSNGIPQYRTEELLLEVICHLASSGKPPRPGDSGEQDSERYVGYYEGYCDAIENLYATCEQYIANRRYLEQSGKR